MLVNCMITWQFASFVLAAIWAFSLILKFLPVWKLSGDTGLASNMSDYCVLQELLRSVLWLSSPLQFSLLVLQNLCVRSYFRFFSSDFYLWHRGFCTKQFNHCTARWRSIRRVLAPARTFSVLNQGQFRYFLRFRSFFCFLFCATFLL